jgi:Cu(I)/Ag(I) efflux system membrane protein CusA/SilA
VLWGIAVSPFNWEATNSINAPVAVDAIPDIGENQQIVFTDWSGRSPQDIDNQITYPLTTYLLGIPGVKSIRSSSMFGISSIYIIFEDEIEYYWSRTRILEKLNSIPSGLLPNGVSPALGPDATALGQVYWYTLEGRDEKGKPAGGWDLDELRSVQDFYVKYGLNSAKGVAEVASVGGFVREYQVDIRPDALRHYGISIEQVIDAVRKSNKDVGAKTMEINKVEYLIRGLGYIKNIKELEQAVVRTVDNTPIRLKDVSVVKLGPADRRGMLDKNGYEAVGGVVVARYGANPMEVIENVKEKIDEISKGLPQKKLADGTISKIEIVPFYDRSTLIQETLHTLEEALSLEILITIIVILLMVANFRASIVIAIVLPVSILMVFIAMKYAGVTANIVALSGIAIAIGTMVDLAIILVENIVKYREEHPDMSLLEVVYTGSAEVSTAILTAVTTTIISFIPVFMLQGAEGKLFIPLAFTKTFALIAAVVVTLLIIPAITYVLFSIRKNTNKNKLILPVMTVIAGVASIFLVSIVIGLTIISIGILLIIAEKNPDKKSLISNINFYLSSFVVAFLLADYWMPLGPANTLFLNFLFVAFLIAVIIGLFKLTIHYYESILEWCLDNKATFLFIPAFILFVGVMSWFGFPKVFSPINWGLEKVGFEVEKTRAWNNMSSLFPGMGEEFMPALDEGSFLLMPTSMPYTGVQKNRELLQNLDLAVQQIPEVEMVVGKAGRVESALDPAPLSMFENIVNYKSEYITDEDGSRLKFKVDDDGRFITNYGDTLDNETAILSGIKTDDLIEDEDGENYRQWRKSINSTDDIWNEIVKHSDFPEITSAPKLQPIETRLVMLQTGMRAPMGIKVYGPDLGTIELFGLKLEEILKSVPSVKSEAVFADRVVGKPYIHINIDREAIARYGLRIDDIQNVIETAIGGIPLSKTVEGRERYSIRVRYPRELRDEPDELLRTYVATPLGSQIPLSQLVELEYVKGPQVIKSENTFLTSYVLFDKRDGNAEVSVVEAAEDKIQEEIESGRLVVPNGVTYQFSGNYENQQRAAKRLSIIIPIVFVIIFIVLYLQFRSVATSLMVFTGIAVALAGGFTMLWLYGQHWFADFSLFGSNLRDLFQMGTVNLSVAVWVGFIALFGIATDDGVVIATYLRDNFKNIKPTSRVQIRKLTIEAGKRRVRPCLMTTATTLIALIPILTSTGRGSDIMIPMAIPAFGGMAIAVITIFVVPVLYSAWEERKLEAK